MTKRSASIVLIALSLITASSVFALESSSSTSARKPIVQRKFETVKEKMASRDAALKLKLDAFKDKRKAQVADRVNTNLNRINQNQTAQMQRHLTNMSAILTKLEARVNSGSPDIKDKAAAKAAIASSRQVIATTSAAVKLQSEKDYTIVVTSETKVKSDATAQRQKLHQDLLALRKQVIDAKQSVGNAIRIAKSGKLDLPGKEVTPSGKQ